jgi:hypothetical protein
LISWSSVAVVVAAVAVLGPVVLVDLLKVRIIR